MHHAPAGPPFSARVAASVTRWALRMRAVAAPLGILSSVLHRSRVLPVTLFSVLIGSLAVVLPVVSSAEPRPGDVALSSTAGAGVSDLLQPTPGGDWTTDGGDPGSSRSTRSGEPTGPSPSSSSPPSSGSSSSASSPSASSPSGPSPSGSSPSGSSPSASRRSPAPVGDDGPETPSGSSSSDGAEARTSAPGTTPSTDTTTSSSSPRTSTSSAPPSSDAPAPLAPAGGPEDQVLALVNVERAAAGCAPVSPDAGLAAVARAHSADMRDRDFFDHVNPDGVGPFDRAARAGLDHARAENIAWGQPDAAAVMASWMDSPGHRANILDCDLRTLGVGAATGPGGPWWTQLFGA